MHRAANDLQVSASPFDANGKMVTWHQQRARLLRSADVLEYSILISRPHFPNAVQQYLDRVVGDINDGRRALPPDSSDRVPLLLPLTTSGEGSYWSDGRRRSASQEI